MPVGSTRHVDTSERIQALRKALKLTQEGVASAAGFRHRTDVAKIESGHNHASSNAVRAGLARAFGGRSRRPRRLPRSEPPHRRAAPASRRQAGQRNDGARACRRAGKSGGSSLVKDDHCRAARSRHGQHRAQERRARLAEVLRTPLAAVGPLAVRVRGPEDWVWPDEPTLRRWAGGRAGRGVRKVRVTDRPARALLIA